MRIAQIFQSCGYMGMIFPVVLLLDSQGTLEQVLLLAVVAQVSMRTAQISQSCGYVYVVFAKFLLLFLQQVLSNLLGFGCKSSLNEDNN